MHFVAGLTVSSADIQPEEIHRPLNLEHHCLYLQILFIKPFSQSHLSAHAI